MNSNPILILIIRPRGYVHAEAFRESAELLHFFLASNSFNAEIQEVAPGDIKTLDPLTPKIIFGAHLDSEISPSSSHVIVNLEQLSRPSTPASYLTLLRHSWFLDYSISHVETELASNNDNCLGFLGLTGGQLVGSNSAITAKTDELLFFGSITSRREAAIQKLRKEGLAVRVISGIYGPELWPWLSRCKAVINIHAYDSCTPFESVRLSSLLANGIPVISEKSIMNPWDKWLIDFGLPFFSMDECSAKVISELQSFAEASAYKIAAESSKKNACDRMARLIEWCGNYVATDEIECPIRPWGLKIEGLHVGSGYKRIPTMINLDINESLEADIVCDICDPSILDSQYFDRILNQTVSLTRNSLATIISDCTFEHLHDLPVAMKNCRDLLVPGGMLYLKVPYDLSFGAWQDPTHKHPFNEKSFLYFYDWAWYLGWSEWGLKPLNIRPVLSAFGSRLREEGKSIDDLSCIPRAIDSLEVLMVKRMLPLPTNPLIDKCNAGKTEDVSREQLLHSYQTKSLYKPSHAISTLLFDSIPEVWQTPSWWQRLKSFKDLTSAPIKHLPTVSVVTPTTCARLPFLANCCIQILQQTYPLDLIEWLIVPDQMSSELQEIIDVAKGVLNIRVVVPSNPPASIGAKRNLCLTQAHHEVIVHFDDDDFYFSNRITAAIDALLKGSDPFSYAGCNQLPIYFVNTSDLWLSTPTSNLACAGSFAYSKELGKRTFFDEQVSNGEEFSFTRNYTIPLLKIDPLDCMVCLAHSSNTFDKDNLRSGGESPWIKKASLNKYDNIPYLCTSESFARLDNIASKRLEFSAVLNLLRVELSAVAIYRSVNSWVRPLRSLWPLSAQ